MTLVNRRTKNLEAESFSALRVAYPNFSETEIERNDGPEVGVRRAPKRLVSGGRTKAPSAVESVTQIALEIVAINV